MVAWRGGVCAAWVLGTGREWNWRMGLSLAYRLNETIVVMEFLRDLWAFMKERKKWWLVPILVVLLLLGVLLVVGGGSAVAPFIYTLF